MTRESTGASCIGQALECSVPPLGSGRGRTPEQGSNAVDDSAGSSQVAQDGAAVLEEHRAGERLDRYWLGLADGNLGIAGEHEGQLAAINARRVPPHTTQGAPRSSVADCERMVKLRSHDGEGGSSVQERPHGLTTPGGEAEG